MPPLGRPHAADCNVIRDGYGPPGATSARAETVVAGLDVPWGLAFLPDGSMLVTERPGRVRMVREGKLVEEPVAVIDVDDDEEGGLLGIAVDPDFTENRRFYVYATQRTGGGKENRVLRYELSIASATAKFDRVVVDGIPSAQYHDGGRLRFGPDAKLYVGTGDARTPSRSQDLDSLGGKILRLETDGEIPSDNPWPDRAVFLRGIRNTQGFDWIDAETLFVTDHGPSYEFGLQGHDEVNVAKAGDNLGWPVIYACGSRDGMVSPVLTWEQAVPPGGAAVYTGDRFPEWKGSLLVGTLRSRHLHRVALDPATGAVATHEVYFDDELGRLRDVVMGPDGELYVTTSNCDGRGNCPDEKDRILRIVPRGVRVP
jgi:aldose sugar dehydrogenase